MSQSRGIAIIDLLNPPSTPKKNAPQLSRDERLQVQSLRNYGNLSYAEIAQKMGFTIRQVQFACISPVTPQKRREKKGLLRTPQKDALREWIRSDRSHRFTSWSDFRLLLPPQLSAGEKALRKALHSLGFQRKARKRMIKRSGANKRERVQWCQIMSRLRPRPENWENVLVCDETWATNDPMWKQWVTLDNDDDPKDFALAKRKPHGWMLWGSFAGGRKGPCFIWEKEFGGVTAHKYIFFILPIVAAFSREHQNIVFQQDNAPSHKAKDTKRAIEQMGISLLSEERFPAYSPDLAPIENVWPWLKSLIELRYDIQSLTPKKLREAVQEAWDDVPEEFLLRLAHSMPERMRQIIEKGGDSIDY